MSHDTSPAPSRRWRLLALLGAAIVGLLVFAGFAFWPRSPEESLSPPPGGAGSRAARDSPSTPPSGGGRSDSPAELVPHEEIPEVICWEGLAELDRSLSLESFRAALESSIGKGDPLLIEYFKERLAELVGADVDRALEVVKWAEAAPGPEYGVYLGGVSKSPALQDLRVSRRLLTLGEDRAGDPERRAGALEALENLKHLETEDLRRLKAVAMDPSAEQTSWMATRTLGRVMAAEYERTGNADAYLDELLEIATNPELDETIRLLAVEMPTYSDLVLRGAQISKFASILKTAGEPQVREMAAMQMSVSQESEKVLQAYSESFKKETDFCVRWAMFRFAARAAGQRALPTLEAMAGQVPDFQPDLAELKRIYGEGVVDFDRVWTEWPERHCLDESGPE